MIFKVYFMCMSGESFLRMYVYAPCACPVPLEVRRGRFIFWNCSCGSLWTTMWVLRIKLDHLQEPLFLTTELSLQPPNRLHGFCMPPNRLHVFGIFIILVFVICLYLDTSFFCLLFYFVLFFLFLFLEGMEKTWN